MAEHTPETLKILSNMMDEALKIRMSAQTLKELVKVLQQSMTYAEYRAAGLPPLIDNGYTGSAEVLALGSLHGTELLLKALDAALTKK